MTTYDDNFEHRLLYAQQSVVEGEMTVASNLYAVKWNYPGAIASTTARVRLTAIYNNDGAGIAVQAGTIEKWTDKGWQVLDEFFDAYLDFFHLDEVHNHLMRMCHSFLMGIPINILEEKSTSKVPSQKVTIPDEGKSSLRVLDFAKANKEKKESNKTQKDKSSSDDKSDDDDPDMEWI